DNFELVWANGACKIRNLHRVEVVRWCQTLEPEVKEGARRQCVRCIQAEVADPIRARLPCSKRQRMQKPARSHYNVAIQSEKETHNALLIGFEDPRAGNTRANVRRLHTVDGGPQAVEIEVVYRDACRPASDRCR